MKIEVDFVSNFTYERTIQTTYRNEKAGLTIVKKTPRIGYMGMDRGRTVNHYYIENIGEVSLAQAEAHVNKLKLNLD